MNSFSFRYRGFANKKSKGNRKFQQKYENIAQAEKMSYIEETLQENYAEVAPFIKLSSVKQYYQSCLMDLNTENTIVSSTRLKVKILNLNKSLQATSGKKVLISYKDDLAEALQYTREHSLDANAAFI